MRDPKLLINIANEAAESYLVDKLDMNKSITKQAEANKLTKEEVQRVVEFANTKTYLELRKTAEQNYVDFDVADSSSILSELNLNEPIKSEDTGLQMKTHSDYKTFPVKEASFEKIAEQQVFEKTAESFSKEEAPIFEKTLNEIGTVMASDKLQYDNRVNKLSNSVKQLLLQGTEASSVKSMFDRVDKSGKIWETIIDKLGDQFPMVKSASADSIDSKLLNVKHPLVKEAYDTSVLLGKLAIEALAFDMIKTAYVDEREMLKQAWLERVHPVVKGMGVLTLAGTVYGLGSKHATATAEREKLEYYNRLRPGRSL